MVPCDGIEPPSLVCNTRAQPICEQGVVGGKGVEPLLNESESFVLPLNEPPITIITGAFGWNQTIISLIKSQPFYR